MAFHQIKCNGIQQLSIGKFVKPLEQDVEWLCWRPRDVYSYSKVPRLTIRSQKLNQEIAVKVMNG
jgi:hypothetical protein